MKILDKIGAMPGVRQREIRMIMVDSPDSVGAGMDMFRDVRCMLNVIVCSSLSVFCNKSGTINLR